MNRPGSTTKSPLSNNVCEADTIRAMKALVMRYRMRRALSAVMLCFCACYVPVESPKKSKDNPEWRVYREPNPIDETETVTAVLDSSSGLNHYGDRIHLLVRCKSNKSEVFVNWGEYMGSEAVEVTSRIGSDGATKASWPLSSDQRATFYPGHAVAFAMRLKSESRLVLEATPYGENPITAVFTLDETWDAIKFVAGECHWK